MKQKKSKPKKPHNKTAGHFIKPRNEKNLQKLEVKKHGKQADLSLLRTQLDLLGLKIIQVTADGNCFFRALADQLEGNEEEHKKYRSMVVQYILSHREDFEPFIEDDVPFDEYCQFMEKDGTWAGHMELQAASLVFRRNICIHQASSPRWYISNFSGREASMVHLSYHDGEHYNSVRLLEDACEGPARPIIIKVDANVSAIDNKKKVTSIESKVSSRKNIFDSGSVKLVMAGAGCANINKVEQLLQEVDGDVDAAIEFLIAELQADTNIDKSDSLPCVSIGDDQNCENLEAAAGGMACEDNQWGSDVQSVQCHDDDKEVARNIERSNGSQKKRAASCGSTVGKSSEAPVANNNRTTRKGKKETKQIKKKEASREIPKCKSESLPDVGALCI